LTSGTYAIGQPEVIVGMIGALRAGHPENPSNKILWVARYTNNSYLTITADPRGASGPNVTYEALPASPGNIYPSTIDVPQPGCWHLDLAYESIVDSHGKRQTRRASVDLDYR
jgi:hypothetical protein